MGRARDYLPWMDELKGLAIAGVVIFHLFQNYPSDAPLLLIAIGFPGYERFKLLNPVFWVLLSYFAIISWLRYY